MCALAHGWLPLRRWRDITLDIDRYLIQFLEKGFSSGQVEELVLAAEHGAGRAG
jgi:hypothetical protein